jgi:hypothetical protein
VTGVQEGGPLCSQGRTISACWGSSSKRKVAMAALQDRAMGNLTHASPAPLPPSDGTAWVYYYSDR